MLDWKQKGNEAFKSGDFQEAVGCFTKAIAMSPKDAVLYSNRSGAYASLSMFKEALQDANTCIELKPDWPKGYSRKGLAEFKLGNIEAAKSAYRTGLQYDPSNENLKNALKDIETEFSMEYMQSLVLVSQVIQANPKLAEYQRQDPSYAQKLSRVLTDIKNNPQNLQSILMDPNPALREGLVACVGMLSESNFKRENEPDFKPEPKKEPEKNETPEQAFTPGQIEANQHKEEGNKLYKMKRFNEALEEYHKASEKDPANLLIENNKAAVYLEMGEYEKCIKTCMDAIEKRYDVKADFVVVSKIYNRLAACYTKMGKYDEALAAYQKSLLEDNNRYTRSAMKEVERMKEKQEREAYIDPELAEKHREIGNAYFKDFKFPEAKMEYDEAIRRNPKDPKLYTNRAAALIKLCEYPSALADCTKALDIDPKFVKAWARKGTLHVLLKEYHKAMDAFEKGLAIDPNSPECLNGRYDCIMRIQQISQSDTVDEEQYKHAMADPEVQQILGDPQFQIILKRLSENPTNAAEYMHDPKIATGIQKLMAAGIIRTH